MRIPGQGVNDASVELRRLGQCHEIVVLLAAMAQHHLGALGELRAEPQRHCGDAGVLEVHRHVGGQLVVSRLLRAVRRAVHVADRSEGRREGDEARALPDHDGRGVVACDVGRTQADVQDAGQRQRLLPEAAGIDQVVVNVRGVVD